MINNKFFVRKNFIFLLLILAILITILFCISRQNVETSVQPVNNRTIVIDAGHGYPDSGATAKDGTLEKNLNLEISKKLKKLLVKQGASVIMTRNGDNSLSDSGENNKRYDLMKRKEIINNSDADVLISIHMNHFQDSKYFGAQVFYNDNKEENKKLAENIQNSLIENADPTNTRKSKADNTIYILKNSKIPAVLVECGFLSNESETKRLNNEDYQNKIAKAICSGISEYFKQQNP